MTCPNAWRRLPLVLGLTVLLAVVAVLVLPVAAADAQEDCPYEDRIADRCDDPGSGDDDDADAANNADDDADDDDGDDGEDGDSDDDGNSAASTVDRGSRGTRAPADEDLFDLPSNEDAEEAVDEDSLEEDSADDDSGDEGSADEGAAEADTDEAATDGAAESQDDDDDGDGAVDDGDSEQGAAFDGTPDPKPNNLALIGTIAGLAGLGGLLWIAARRNRKRKIAELPDSPAHTSAPDLGPTPARETALAQPVLDPTTTIEAVAPAGATATVVAAEAVSDDDVVGVAEMVNDPMTMVNEAVDNADDVEIGDMEVDQVLPDSSPIDLADVLPESTEVVDVDAQVAPPSVDVVIPKASDADVTTTVDGDVVVDFDPPSEPTNF